MEGVYRTSHLLQSKLSNFKNVGFFHDAAGAFDLFVLHSLDMSLMKKWLALYFT